MLDFHDHKLKAHRNNIVRYKRLLRTPLTYDERRFIERRLAAETNELDRLRRQAFRNARERARVGGHINPSAALWPASAASLRGRLRHD